MYFGDCKENDAFTNFHDAAQSNDKYTFYATAAGCAGDHGVTAPGMALFRGFDESPLVFKAGDDTAKFLSGNSVASFFEFSEDSVEPIFHDQQPVLLLLLDGESPAKAVVAEAAQALKGEIMFSHSGVTEGIQEQLGEFIGVTADDLPTLRILAPTEESIKKFKWEGDVTAVTVDDIKKFVADFKAGTLSPFLKSEKAPENNDGPVKIVVSSQFKDIVMDSTKDVLVKYYAPWCGHCQSLAPHWEKLGEHVKDVSDIVIAKYDATLNENEGVNIEGFPTLMFYPKDNKDGVNAEGRSLNGLKKWLGANSEAYKAAFPGEEVEVDEDEPEEGDEGEEGEDMEGMDDEDEDDPLDEDEDDDMANLEDLEDEGEIPEGTEDL